ncbi:hypothetical protein KI387_020413, partial [Taxus chinensis]
TNDGVVDEHVHKEKSDLKDTIHLHHEPFEGQEGSMSLIVTPSHFLHDTSIGEGEKRGLDEENDEGKSGLKLKNYEFCRCWGQPKFGASWVLVTGSSFDHLALLLLGEQRRGRYGAELSCYVLRKKVCFHKGLKKLPTLWGSVGVVFINHIFSISEFLVDSL